MQNLTQQVADEGLMNNESESDGLRGGVWMDSVSHEALNTNWTGLWVKKIMEEMLLSVSRYNLCLNKHLFVYD